MLKLTIPGVPIALARPRFNKQGRVFDSQKSEKAFVRNIIQTQIADKRTELPYKGPLHLHMTYHTPIPKSWPKKRRESVVGKPDVTSKKDLDNMDKLYMDCMNGLVYQDDRQVTSLSARKIYSKYPRTDICISEDPGVFCRILSDQLQKAKKILTHNTSEKTPPPNCS